MLMSELWSWKFATLEQAQHHECQQNLVVGEMDVDECLLNECVHDCRGGSCDMFHLRVMTHEGFTFYYHTGTILSRWFK